MAETITIRTDDDVTRALRVLTADGRSISHAVRHAVLDAARIAEQKSVREEAARLSTDATDREEIAAVLRDMETLRAW